MKFVNANGAAIPALGFGTFRMPAGETERMVSFVLKNGYRHVDTAQIYGNEAAVGDGILLFFRQGFEGFDCLFHSLRHAGIISLVQGRL